MPIKQFRSPIPLSRGILILGNGVGTAVSSGTAEVVLGTVTVPAGLMGLNGTLRISTLWTYTNSGNNKIMRVRYSGAAGTVFGSLTATTTAQFQTQTLIHNNNATNAQIGYGQTGSSSAYGAGTGALFTATADTTAATTISFSGQPATGGETITLAKYLVEFLPGV